MVIDTLSIANRLKAAERDGRVAEEIALVFRDIDEERYQRLATREDLEREAAATRAEAQAEFERVRAESRAEFERVRAESRAEFEKVRLEMQQLELRLKHDLTLRLGGLVVAAMTVLSGLNVLF